MNILGIYGSPRANGNSARLLDTLLQETVTRGATVKKYHLNTLNIRGCQACYRCRQPGSEGVCALKDDMQAILEDLLNADAVVLGSPVYMWQMTAQAKLFTDRLMPLLKPDYSSRLSGQRLLTVYTQGQPDVTMFSPYFQHVNSMFSFLGFRTLEPLVFGGLRNVDDITSQPAAFAAIKQAAEDLISG